MLWSCLTSIRSNCSIFRMKSLQKTHFDIYQTIFVSMLSYRSLKIFYEFSSKSNVTFHSSNFNGSSTFLNHSSQTMKGFPTLPFVVITHCLLHNYCIHLQSDNSSLSLFPSKRLPKTAFFRSMNKCRCCN